MLYFGDIRACVKSNSGGTNSELQEFGVERVGKTICCWIISEDDKAFTVDCGYDGASMDFEYCLFIDGIEVHRKLLSRRKALRTKTFHGFANNINTVLPFVFSRATFKSEDSDGFEIPDLGVIEIKAFRVTITHNEGNPSLYRFSNGLDRLMDDVVSEKGKALAPHRVKLSTDEIKLESTKQTRVKVAPYDRSELGPYVTFRFQYRPRDLLQARGILPAQNHSISTSNNETDLDRQLDDDIKESENHLLCARQARRPAPYTKNKVKQELGTTVLRRPFSYRDTNYDRVIDLTDD